MKKAYGIGLILVVGLVTGAIVVNQFQKYNPIYKLKELIVLG